MKDKNTTIKLVVFFIIAWLLFCLLFTFSVKDSGNTDFATIGNYIAGIFAPISTILFFVSILIQKSGLDDQNKRSLEQSQVVERQLQITEQRYQNEQKEIEDNKPKFAISSNLNNILNSVGMLGKFDIEIPIENKRGAANATDVEVSFNPYLSIDNISVAYLADTIVFTGIVSHRNDNCFIKIYSETDISTCLEHFSKQNWIDLSGEKAYQRETRKLIANLLSELKLNIFYDSRRIGANSDYYNFEVNYDFNHIEMKRH